MKRLKELQAKRETLAAEIRTLTEDQTTDNWQDNYDKVNADYAAVMVDLTAAQTEYEAELAQKTAITDRLAQLDTDDKAGTLKNLGRDNGRIDDHADATVLDRYPSDKQLSMGLQAWLAMASSKTADAVTDAHRQAAQACGINLASAETEIRISNSAGLLKIRNAMESAEGAAGGFTIAESFINRLEVAMLSFGSVLGVAEIIRTSLGNAMRWPMGDDTSNTGEQVGESVSVDGSVEPTFTQLILNAYKFSSKMVKVPFELIRDSEIDLASLISGMLGERLGRIQSTKFTTGSGASTPTGIVTASILGKTTAAAAAIAPDEMIDLEHSVDPARRVLGSSWMFHDNVLKAIRKLKDGEGNYLWQRGFAGTAPDTILGYTFTVNQDMASTIEASAKTILFGPMSMYKVRQVGSIRLRRLDERYAEYDQTAFIAFVEADGNILNAGDDPIRHMIQV